MDEERRAVLRPVVLQRPCPLIEAPERKLKQDQLVGSLRRACIQRAAQLTTTDLSWPVQQLVRSEVHRSVAQNPTRLPSTRLAHDPDDLHFLAL